MRVLIFDLDNTLSAASEVGSELVEPVIAAIRAANRGTLCEERLEQAFSDLWRLPFDEVAERHRFTPAMFEAGWDEYARIEIGKPMHGYADLKVLASMPAARFLVTSGFRRLQESKIDALGIRGLFAGIFIDAIDEPGRKGKLRIFRDILVGNRLAPTEVIVVGDNPESEIAAGNSLGMRTVQILRAGVARDPSAGYHVTDLNELLDLIREIEEEKLG